MGNKFKKLLSPILSIAMIAGAVTVPITADAAEMKSWKFDFGASAPSDSSWTQVTSKSVYSDEVGYGFLGQSTETCNYPAVVDGYTQSADNKTTLADGGSSTDVYSDYVYTDDEYMPIRFAVKVDNNTYYKVKVTMGNSDKDSEIYLTSERRHFVLTGEKITAGGKIEKEFTAAVHSVKWKNRGGTPAEPIYEDDMLNICVHGKNALINAIEIEQVAKPKVAWVFGDSTVTDGGTGVPWFGYNTYAGWGIAVAKYLPSDVAVVNLGEGGLSTVNRDYFNVGKDDITAGDIFIMQMGHNDTSTETYKANLDYYYDSVTAKNATFVLCGPIERLSSASTAAYNTAAQEYAASKNTPFVSLHNLTKQMYTDLGDVKKWYTHSCMWTGTAANPTVTQDATHLNDFGADKTTKMLFETLSTLSGTYTTLAPYVTAQAAISGMELSDEVMKGGTSDYVKPPNKLFPYPESSIDYKNIIDITSAETENVNGVEYLKSYTTVRHSDLTYITAFAAVYNADGTLAALRQNRLEPMSAKTVETISLVTDKTPNGLAIPEGGSYKTFVWNGAFSDNSMSFAPYSTVFSGYDYLEKNVAASAWQGATETGGAVTVTSAGAYKTLTTPVTSGKVMAQFTIEPNTGDTVIALSPANNAVKDNAIVLTVNSATGSVYMDLGETTTDGKSINTTVIDSVKAGTECEMTLTYDINYGILNINVDGVGVVDVEIPDAITVNAITPPQIASIGFTGDAVIKDLTISTLKTSPLPEKTLTLEYDEAKGSVSRTDLTEPADAGKSITADKNTNIRLSAKAAPTEEHNYVFGGWYNEDGTLFSANTEISLYLVEDFKLKADFYEQRGLEGLADYKIITDKNTVKVPESGSTTVTLDIDNCVDSAGNPVAAFDHNGNVTWALKTTVDGLSISGNNLAIASTANISKEEMKKIVVEATCNNVKREYTILVHNCTNIIYNEDFQSKKVDEAVSGWTVAVPARCANAYKADGDNIYLAMDWVILPNENGGDTNNGTTVTGNILNSLANGVVQVRTDVLMKQPTGSEPNREMVVGFSDDKNNYAVKLSRNQGSNNYKVNGIALADVPSDTDWVTVTAIMNYMTKTADVNIISLDGTKTYFDQNVPFASDATGFQKIIYETNRYNTAVKFDNIIINHIAAQTDIPDITLSTEEVEITNLTQSVDVDVTVPNGWTLASATSSDNEIATVAKTENGITITPASEGDAVITLLVTNDSNKYIKVTKTVPVAIKKMDNANLASLSVKTNAGSELIDVFAGDTEEYNVRTEKTVTGLTVTPVTDSSQATYTVSYNGTEVTGGAVTIDAEAETQTVEITVTAQDGTTEKTYTVDIDNSYDIAENFAVAPANNWGFKPGKTGSVVAANGVLGLITNTTANNEHIDTKTFDSVISSAKKLTVEFDWRNGAESGKGRDSAFNLLDGENYIFSLYGRGNVGVRYNINALAGQTTTSVTGGINDHYRVALTIDFTNADNKTISGTITDLDTNAVTTIAETTLTNAEKLSAIDAGHGYSAAAIYIDNFYIKVIE